MALHELFHRTCLSDESSDGQVRADVGLGCPMGGRTHWSDPPVRAEPGYLCSTGPRAAQSDHRRTCSTVPQSGSAARALLGQPRLRRCCPTSSHWSELYVRQVSDLSDRFTSRTTLSDKFDLSDVSARQVPLVEHLSSTSQHFSSRLVRRVRS
jgi:hypothetical protein